MNFDRQKFSTVKPILFQKFNFFLVFTLFLFFTNSSNAQYSQDAKQKESMSFDKSKLSWGGYFWLDIFSLSYVDISPKITYRLSEKIQPGIGFTYQYFRQKISGYANSYIQKSTYGGNAFLNYLVYSSDAKTGKFKVGNLFGCIEYDFLNTDMMQDSIGSVYNPDRVWVNCFFAGVGISQKLGGHSTTYAMVLYDLIGNANSPFTNPVIRVGFNF